MFTRFLAYLVVGIPILTIVVILVFIVVDSFMVYSATECFEFVRNGVAVDFLYVGRECWLLDSLGNWQEVKK